MRIRRRTFFVRKWHSISETIFCEKPNLRFYYLLVTKIKDFVNTAITKIAYAKELQFTHQNLPKPKHDPMLELQNLLLSQRVQLVHY